MLCHLRVRVHASLHQLVQPVTHANFTPKKALSNSEGPDTRVVVPKQCYVPYPQPCRTAQPARHALLSAGLSLKRGIGLQATRNSSQTPGPAQSDDQSTDAAGSVARRRRAPPSGLRRSAGSAPPGQQQGRRQPSDVQNRQPPRQPPGEGDLSRQPQQDRPAANRQLHDRNGRPTAVFRSRAYKEAGSQQQPPPSQTLPQSMLQPLQQAPVSIEVPGWVRQLQPKSVLTVPLPPVSKRLSQVPQPLPALQPQALASAAQLTDRLCGAIGAEVAEEQAAVKRLYSETAVDRMREDGLVLTDLIHRADGQLHGSSVWRLTPQQQGQQLPFHRFNQRSLVLLSPWSSRDNGAGAQREADRDLSIPATVLSVGRSHLRVVVESDSHAAALQSLQTHGVAWRMDEDLTDATIKRQYAAIEELPHLRRCTEAELRLRSIVLGSPQAAELSRKISSWGESESWRLAVQQRMQAMMHLNYSQKQAVGAALLSTLTLWQGPPGTGKTRTLLALVALVCGAAQSQGTAFANDFGPILATAGTNAAADNLLEGLAEIPGIKVVRVGQPASIRDGLRHLSLAALAEATPAGQKALHNRQLAQRLRERAASDLPVSGLGKEEAWSAAENAAKQLEAGAAKVLQDAETCILDHAQVVVSTCASAGAAPLQGRFFRMLVIDEATQATEPMTLIPLIKGIEACVMAGDPQQLPPTVKSAAGLKAGLDCTLFTRLADLGVSPMLLDTQYRMHPDIADLPSRLFYNGKLRSGVPPSERPLPRGVAWPNPKVPVALLPCEDGYESMSDAAGPKGSAGRGNSYSNMREAELAIRTVMALLSGGDIESAAILTPYAGQVRLLNRLAKAQPSDSDIDSVDISSVDAYQGREADVIVFSTVRCNRERRLGFVTDPRRLNVAITRPRRGLVVVGSASTLCSSKDWRQWLQWVKLRSAITSEDALLAPVYTC